MAFILYVTLFLLFESAAAFMDPCTFYPRGFIPQNETEVVMPTPSCKKGIIDWNYPRGSLNIQFKQQAPFTLCIKDWIGGDAFTVYDNSFGKEAPVHTLSTENQCIRSNGHKAILDVKAPPEQRYMGGFSFEIKF